MWRAVWKRRCLPSDGDAGEARSKYLMLGGSFLRLSPPLHLPHGLCVGWPSCHLSNDFFILQEELVARGNAPLPAWGNPTLGQADAGTRYVCGHITGDQHTLSSCLCFFAFFLSLYPHSHQYHPFFSERPTRPRGRGLTLLLSSNSFLLTSK